MSCLHDRTFCPRAVFLFFLVVCFAGCSGYVIKADRPKGVYHRIKKGETLWSIARAYHVHVQDIAETNNIDNPSLIETNQVIFIPTAKQIIDDVMSAIIKQKTPKTAPKAATPPKRKEKEVKFAGQETAKKEGESALSSGGEAGATAAVVPPDKSPPTVAEAKTEEVKTIAGDFADEPEYEMEEALQPSAVKEGEKITEATAKLGTPAKQADELRFDRKRFIWPVKGNIASRFGIQPNGMFYNGIRIAAKEGQPVVASDSGTVIFSSSIKDYGETVIVKHEDNYATVYTNLGGRIVKTDDKVKRGDQIALLSKGDKKIGAFMNFEIRQRNKARNPLFFLP
ncbi:MAG: M23 family metallopeptidase [Deltaproteobacteria bacterium]|nr:M23 family metallopeptidase [Deltaproteobacteria bacterium]